VKAYLVLSMLVLLLGCGSTSSPSSNQVAMKDFTFNPESLNVAVGDTVTWVNQGAYDHTTTSGEVGSPDGNWDSGVMAPGAEYKHVFAAVGNFHYYCALHGATYGMKGVISVH
jgi:plastocyanin